VTEGTRTPDLQGHNLGQVAGDDRCCPTDTSLTIQSTDEWLALTRRGLQPPTRALVPAGLPGFVGGSRCVASGGLALL
jgi:hypothetical protein